MLIKKYIYLCSIFLLLGCFWGSFAQAGNPVWGTLTSDGQELRTIFYEAPGSGGYPVTLVFLQGRCSFIEKYQDVLEKLNGMGYRVWSFDWRGQGGSPHTLPQEPHKFHIESFDTYLEDLDLFIKEKVRSKTAAPIVLIGSSFGSHIAFRYLEDYPEKVQGAILISPMLEVFTPPFPRFLAKYLTRLFCWLGFDKSYVFGYGNFDLKKDSFYNKNTHDEEKGARQHAVAMAHPDLITGGITYAWANALFASLKKQNNLEALQRITVPVLVLAAEKDTVVDLSRRGFFEKTVKTLTWKSYKGAYHALLRERADIEEKVWKDIRFFLKRKL